MLNQSQIAKKERNRIKRKQKKQKRKMIQSIIKMASAYQLKFGHQLNINETIRKALAQKQYEVNMLIKKNNNLIKEINKVGRKQGWDLTKLHRFGKFLVGWT